MAANITDVARTAAGVFENTFPSPSRRKRASTIKYTHCKTYTFNDRRIPVQQRNSVQAKHTKARGAGGAQSSRCGSCFTFFLNHIFDLPILSKLS